MADVVLQGVSKMFAGRVTAVQDLDLEIRDRELVVLLGPSGCGKTTTLRLIAGLEDPDRGAIWIDGRQVNRVAPRDRNIAMVFQHSVLYPHMTVFQNLAVGRWWCGDGNGIRRYVMRWWHAGEARRQEVQRRAIAQQVLDVSRLLGIEHLLERRPGELSGGECQRVALGRAIVRQPAAFLLDEPLSHLDAQMRVELRRELKRLHQRLQATLVYVTHDQAEALALGDRIVVMQHGRIQQAGSPREVYERPANVFVAGFLGAPGMNLITGGGRRVAGAYCFQSGGLALSLAETNRADSRDHDDGAVILGIRPEHLELRGSAVGQEHGWRCRDGGIAQVIGRGRVKLSEFWGPASLATVVLDNRRGGARLGDERLTEGTRRVELAVAMPPGQVVEVGHEVVVGLDPSRAHLFDARTGERICAVRPGEGIPA